MPRTAKSKSTSKKSAKSKRSAAGETNAAKAHRQTAAILTFAAAILFLCMVIIPGASLWGALHNVLLGLFGVCAYALPVLMMYIAVIAAMDKPIGSVSAKLWECVVLIALVDSLIHVSMMSVTENFFEVIKQSYVQGRSVHGGGVMGGILGYPMEYLFTDVGAKIIIILLIFVFLMLMTGTTVMALFHAASKPVRKAKETIETAMINSNEKAEREKESSIDIDLGDGYGEMPEHPVRSEKLEALERAARDLNTDVSVQPDGAAESPAAGKPMSKPEEKPADKPVEKSAEKSPEKVPAKPKTESQPPERDDQYHYPPIALLDDARPADSGSAAREQQTTAETLVKTLNDFNISTKVVDISRGPTVTRYELEPSAGVKISRITNLSDDIAMRLATTGVRIEAPIPNKAAVGIEVPNKVSNGVCLREIIDSKEFSSSKSKLTVALGKDIGGNIVLADLAKMPHLLIAGTTGSGKSVCTNSMIQSVLYKSSPSEVRMLLIDPKQVEFGIYNGIPHLLVPVVTDPRKAAGALGWAVTEMLNRYKLFAENNVRDLTAYNELVKRSENMRPLPLILIVIDELADLMMAAANEVEDAIIRLAQMARAAGMHLVIATQRPSVDVITGLIKANIPSRLALTVASNVDSRTILDTGGAEKLLGKGDMLFMPIGCPKPMRVQGCFVSNREVESVVTYLKDAEDHEYDDKVIEEIDRQAAAAATGKSSKTASDDEDEDTGGDDMMPQAIEVVVEAGVASTSLLQRRLRLGYARAGRLIDQMEKKGIVGPYEGSKPRQVLITRQQWLEMNMNHSDDE